MADISMCRGVGCDVKDLCYRHTARMDEYQTMSSFDKTKNGNCEYFWSNENTQLNKINDSTFC